MSDTPTIYRSTHPDVLTAWSEVQVEWDAFHDHLRALKDQHPDNQVKYSTDRRVQFVGLGGETDPGDGWRADGRLGLWVPDKRTTAGKQLAAGFDEIALTDPRARVPGMPSIVFHVPHWYSPGYTYGETVLWVKWGCSYHEVEGDGGFSATKFDGALWERGLASEYYAALEAKEAQTANAT